MTESPSATSAMWGGRFASGPAAIMEEINASIDFDQALADQDLRGSRAHCRMLMDQGIIDRAAGEAILAGLDTIATEVAEGRFPFTRALEDIHMNVEGRLKTLIGEAAGRLHTARSRNDQVATDLRLWVRDHLDLLDADLAALQAALLDQAAAHVDTLLPGCTHLQVAQPVSLAHHLLAYTEMLGRDRGRLADARRRLNECPLGAAALAGTAFPIDRHATATALGFDRPMANSLDAVSDRDFVLEVLAAQAILATHLSRLGEELVLWATPQFGYIDLPDSFATGSSIMPQKKNPDAAELVRAKAGRVIGALTGLLTVMKGLPLAYSKDMQEDKEPVFDATRSVVLGVRAMTGMMAELTFRPEAMAAAAGQGHSTATDLADWLVRSLDLPFREAHHVTGALVKAADRLGCSLAELPLAEMQAVEPRLTDAVRAVLTVPASVASRTSFGGTSPVRVRDALAAARARFLSPTETGSP